MTVRPVWRGAGVLVRSLRQAPIYAFAVVTSLALAIAGTTAAFVIIDRVLFAQASWKDPDSLYLLVRRDRGSNEPERTWSYGRVGDVARGGRTIFTGVAGVGKARVVLSWGAEQGTPGGTQLVGLELVSPEYFLLAGVAPVAGTVRLGDPGEAGTVAVISARLWTSLFQNSRGAIGSTLSLNGVPVRIAGIAPDGFHGLLGGADVWAPIASAPTILGDADVLGPYYWGYAIVARLPHGSGRAAMSGPLNVLADAIQLTQGTKGRARLELEPPRDALVRTELRSALLALLGGGICVLLLTFMNVASLAIARTIALLDGVVIRIALGAGTRHLFGRLLMEGALLAGLGTAAGAILAHWGTLALWSLRPATDIDWVRVLDGLGRPHFGVHALLAFGIAWLGAAVVLGIWPLLEVRRQYRRGGLSLLGRARSRRDRHPMRLRRSLASLQMAAAFLLVLMTTQLTTHLRSIRRQPTGIAAHNLLTARLRLSRTHFDTPRATQFYRALIRRLEAMPGVVAVGVDNTLPLQPTAVQTPAQVDGAPGAETSGTVSVRYHTVSAGYFRAMAIPVVLGRGVSASDVERGGQVAVVNRTAMRRLWGGNVPVGRSVTSLRNSGGGGSWQETEVVGVVGDAQYDTPGTPPDADIFVPISTDPPLESYLAIRTDGNPSALVGALRRAVTETDPQALLYDPVSMLQRVEESTSATRFVARILGAYAALALALAILGVYSVTAYDVGSRTREFGVMVAVGASPAAVMRLVLGDALRMAAVGVAFGLAGGVVAHRLIGSRVAGLGAIDPAFLGWCVLLFALMAAFASFVPAMRAIRVDPTVALRSE